MNELFPLLNFFKTIPGAISVTEAIALYKIIQTYLITDNKPNETFIDFGSYAGKSSLVAIAALSSINKEGHFFMVEPIYNQHHKTIKEDVCAFINFKRKNITPILLRQLLQLIKQL